MLMRCRLAVILLVASYGSVPAQEPVRWTVDYTASSGGSSVIATTFAELGPLDSTSHALTLRCGPGGGTQSCPDPHFQIDVGRLRPVLERLAPGGAMAPDVAERHLAELLKEPGVVVKTTQLTFDPPQPEMDTKVWNDAIYKAELQCVADSGR